MPRTKSASTATSTATRPRPAKKPVTKTLHPKKRTKSVLVDVIEDEPLTSDSAWLEPEDKAPVAKTSSARSASLSEDHPDLDQQKKFYAGLADELQTKDKDAAKPDKRQAKRRVGLYRRLVIKFVCLVAIIMAVVAYFSFSQLTVTLKLKGEDLNDNLLLSVSAATSTPAATSTSLLTAAPTDPREPVSGTIQIISASATKTYAATGETYLGEDIVGQVNIINNYNKDQALVAKTRLLSPDNKLFRIKNAVNVPAGGQVAVAIYTDKPTSDLAIAPTTFTIPGLWAGLQDKIFAKSDTAFVYQQKVKKYVTASDLDQATQDINNAVLNNAKAQISSTLATSTNWLYTSVNPATVAMSAKIGSQVDQFNAQATGQIIAISFDQTAAAKLAAAKLNLLIPDDKELTNFDPANISYTLDNYDPITKSATIKAVFSGTMILKSDSQVINPEQLVNLTADQVGTYLNSQPEIQSYTLKFFPSFLKRAPSLVDRIKIVVSKD